MNIYFSYHLSYLGIVIIIWMSRISSSGNQ